MKAMDEDEKEALVEMLIANSTPIRMMESLTERTEDESRESLRLSVISLPV